MGSLGGLDVAYGSSMQIVKTNVMCIALATTGLANVTTVPKFILNTYKEGLKGSIIEPDFLYVYEVAQIGASGIADSLANANLLFNNDTTGDGVADTTSLEQHGILRDIRQCPMKVNSAFADTTAVNAVFSTAYPLHTYDNIHGNMALQSVLNISAVALDDTVADQAATGVFSDNANADPNAQAGLFAQNVEALAMKEVYDDAMATTGGNLNALAKSTGGHRGPYTMNLQTALQQLETGPAIATGADPAVIDAFDATTTFGAMAAAMTGDTGIISVTSICKV